MIMRFFFAVGWYLTIGLLHLTDIRIWKWLTPFIITALLGFVIGKYL